MKNLIKNWDFEGPWREFQGIHELKVAEEWEPWWDLGSSKDKRPEFKIATPDIDPRRIADGQQAQQWFTTYATHKAGIVQNVRGLEYGATYQLSALLQAFMRHDDKEWVSEDARYRMWVGINPYGEPHSDSPDIIWSAEFEPYDAFETAIVEFVAKSDRATVWIKGEPEWPYKHCNGYVENVRLVKIADGDKLPPPDDDKQYVYLAGDQAKQIIDLMAERVMMLMAERLAGL